MKLLAPGFPLIADYEALLRTDFFKSIERFSNEFLSRHACSLAAYQRKWVADPLHQWSRQWEYPFVYSRIIEYAGSAECGSRINILDAGAGVTFFPWFIKAEMPACDLTCIDRDGSLAMIYENISSAGMRPVVFSRQDLHRMAFPDASFDIVYCVSVLEHTDNYETIVAEFRRILKPGGLLIVTFDIAICGDADIPPEKAETLLRVIDRSFTSGVRLSSPSLLSAARSQAIVTTKYAGGLDKRLLPWRYPWLGAIKSLTRLRWPRSSILTVFCAAFDA